MLTAAAHSACYFQELGIDHESDGDGIVESDEDADRQCC